MPSKKPGQKADKEPKRVRKRDTGDVVPLNIEITPAKKAAIEACRAKLRWTQKVLVDVALEEFLAKHNFWPFPGSGDDASGEK